MYKKSILSLFVFLLLLPSYSGAEQSGFPFFGDYEGVFTSRGKYPLNKEKARCVAEVVPLGNHEYAIHFMGEFNSRAEKYGQTRGVEKNRMVIFTDESARGKIAGDSLTGELLYNNDWLGFTLKKVLRPSPTAGVNPVPEAMVLFDGSGFEEWAGDENLPVKWKVVNGNEAEVVPSLPGKKPKTDIISKRSFTDLFLHLEFKLSLMADRRGQERANSGVIFEGLGEIQILDSYGLEGYWNDCGSLYRRSPPKVNMCAPPLCWQTYDIILHSAKYDETGILQKGTEITVFHNGKRIHYKYPLKKGPGQLAPGQKVPPFSIRLQDHKNLLWFRNIWALDLSKNPELPGFIKELNE